MAYPCYAWYHRGFTSKGLMSAKIPMPDFCPTCAPSDARITCAPTPHPPLITQLQPTHPAHPCTLHSPAELARERHPHPPRRARAHSHACVCAMRVCARAAAPCRLLDRPPRRRHHVRAIPPRAVLSGQPAPRRRRRARRRLAAAVRARPAGARWRAGGRRHAGGG
eukprot:6387844-Prymnesium_polylepis.1